MKKLKRQIALKNSMDRKKTYKQPTVEKLERNPLRDLKPGIFIPEFRLFGLDKATDETTVKYYDATQYVERKANHRSALRMGCEVRLSETSPKTLNIRHQNERRLHYELDEILRCRHRALEDNTVTIQKLATERTMKIQRTTVPLKDLLIPACSYREVLCTCNMKGETECRIHLPTTNKQPAETTLHRQPTKPHHLKKKPSFLITSVDSDSDDDRYATVPKPSHSSSENQTLGVVRTKRKPKSLTPRMSRSSPRHVDGSSNVDGDVQGPYQDFARTKTKKSTQSKSVMFEV